MDPRAEMQELERLWQAGPHSSEFIARQRTSKWGDLIREEVIEGIQRGDPSAIEDGILFLEVSPRYFRSGYFKASIASKLKRAPLTDGQRKRLRQVILAAVDSDVGPEFSEYARLAVVVADTGFVERLREREQTSHGWVCGRLRRVLALCRKHGAVPTAG